MLAFTRSHEGRRILVVLAKWMAQLLAAERQLPLGEVWADTSVAFGKPVTGTLRNVFTGVTLEPGERLSVAAMFEHAPFGVWVCEG